MSGKRIGAVVVWGVLLIAGVARAEMLRPGMAMPEIRLMDQHDVEATIGADARFVLVTRDMDSGNLVKEALAENGAATLAAAHAVYVSDISRMPGVVTTLFALPAMRKRSYRVLLDRDGKATADIPNEEGKITALEIADGAIARIHFVTTVEGLRALLNAK
jgi:hypothetical protein